MEERDGLVTTAVMTIMKFLGRAVNMAHELPMLVLLHSVPWMLMLMCCHCRAVRRLFRRVYLMNETRAAGLGLQALTQLVFFRVMAPAVASPVESGVADGMCDGA